MRLTLGEIARRCGGDLRHGDAVTEVSSVVTDSRDAAPGALFVAIAGERVDGHDFAAEVTAAGAVAILAARELPECCIVVEDPVLALGRLAASVRADLGATVVGITGSSGKTSTKDLVAAVLAAAGPTVSPVGSFNTEVGLPMTIVGAGDDTRFLVLEMGMRGRGHITYLAQVAAPDIGVVTNVGSAHVELLGSRDAIAAAKSELVAALPAQGMAVLNGDDVLVRAMSSRTAASVILVGEESDNQIRAIDVRLDDRARAAFLLKDQRSGESAEVRLQVSGRHQVANALAAAGVGRAVGLSVEVIAERLSQAQPVSRWRMEVADTAAGYTVINDAYNANPESTRAALESLVAMPGRRWAVLGEMRELGDQSADAHGEIGRMAVRLGVDRLVCVGDATSPMHLGAQAEGAQGEQSVLVPDMTAAQNLLESEVRAGDVVLVKASRSIGLDRLAIWLTEKGSA